MIDTRAMTCKVGDWVGFKSDYEQSGEIIAIDRGTYWPYTRTYVLENLNGFGGEYLRYATRTSVRAEDCWVN